MTNIKKDGIGFIASKIKDAMNVDVEKLDFTTFESEVIAFDDFGMSFMLTNNPEYIGLFKAYEELKYGKI